MAWAQGKTPERVTEKSEEGERQCYGPYQPYFGTTSTLFLIPFLSFIFPTVLDGGTLRNHLNISLRQDNPVMEKGILNFSPFLSGVRIKINPDGSLPKQKGLPITEVPHCYPQSQDGCRVE